MAKTGGGRASLKRFLVVPMSGFHLFAGIIVIVLFSAVRLGVSKSHGPRIRLHNAHTGMGRWVR